MSQIVNAIIESATLRMERGCFLSGHVFVAYGDGGHQGLGGYILGGSPDAAAGRHLEQKNLAAMWLVGVMRSAGVDDFDKLAGKAVRIKRGDGWNGLIEAIGHITKDDRWFNPSEEFARAAESQS